MMEFSINPDKTPVLHAGIGAPPQGDFLRSALEPTLGLSNPPRP